jgi:two-component system nitrate/nitrite sensor histidine kinase NarX
MKRLFATILQTLRNSILVRLGLTMGALALLSFASIVMSTVIAEDISGKASAINISGSLRMMSFRALSELQQPALRQQALATTRQFEKRLRGLERFIVSKSAPDSPPATGIAAILDTWKGHIQPLAEQSAAGSLPALRLLERDIPDFVEDINAVVLLIEQDLEEKVRWLRLTQLVLLGCIILVSLLTGWMLRQQVICPLAQLLQAAQAVSQGSFAVRVAHLSDDELGQLGRAFNSMVEEIAGMYGHLEEKVADKTRELTRTNESLELLYRISQRLSASDLTLDNIQDVLRDIEDALELGHSMICISENGQLPAHPVIGTLSEDELQGFCGQQDCGRCFARSDTALSDQSEQSTTPAMIVVPIGDSEQLRGVMPIFLRDDRSLPRDKARIIETVGHHVTNALANMRRAGEKHRLAVLEERSVIARELHDSIAQSLSYLKIQVTRLDKSLDNDGDTRAIANELRDGLNTAYRELRELITTFRLRIDERGFNAALHETITEFSAKLGFALTLDSTLSGIVLSGNEEMHVIRIIREALSNIERHAEASAAAVHISVDARHAVSVRISDNGKGFDRGRQPANHFGLGIMADRSQILAGRLEIDSAAGAGTTITLHFLPQKYQQTPT